MITLVSVVLVSIVNQKAQTDALACAIPLSALNDHQKQFFIFRMWVYSWSCSMYAGSHSG